MYFQSFFFLAFEVSMWPLLCLAVSSRVGTLQGFPILTFEGCLPPWLTLEGAQSPVTNLDNSILLMGCQKRGQSHVRYTFVSMQAFSLKIQTCLARDIESDATTVHHIHLESHGTPKGNSWKDWLLYELREFTHRPIPLSFCCSSNALSPGAQGSLASHVGPGFSGFSPFNRTHSVNSGLHLTPPSRIFCSVLYLFSTNQYSVLQGERRSTSVAFPLCPLHYHMRASQPPVEAGIKLPIWQMNKLSVRIKSPARVCVPCK